MTEPMQSFAEYRCANCRARANVPTRLTMTRDGMTFRVAWPRGWAVIRSDEWAHPICARCVAPRAAVE